MALFDDIYTKVMDHTRRPELVALTKSAIRTAVLRAHHLDFFPRDKDIKVLSYTVDPSTTFYDFSMAAELPKCRTVAKVYSSLESDRTGTFALPQDHLTEELEYREIDDLYDENGCRRRYIYTVVADTLRCFPETPTGRLNVVFFKDPDTSDAGLNSWIARQYEDDVAAWAAAIVFARSGFLEQAQYFDNTFVRPFKDSLVQSNLLGTVS